MLCITMGLPLAAQPRVSVRLSLKDLARRMARLSKNGSLDARAHIRLLWVHPLLDDVRAPSPQTVNKDEAS